MYAGMLQELHPVTTRYTDIGETRAVWCFADYAAEYRAIRSSAALFDHTSIGLTRLSGDVSPLLQRVLGRDIDYLDPEQCMMSLMLDDDAVPVDLVTVYSFDEYVLIESAWGRAEATREHLRRHAGPGIEVEALDGELGVIGIEGPYAWGVVGRVIDPAITALPYESVLEIDWNGERIIFTRSGVSGEYGYKLIGPRATLAALWEVFSTEAVPAGLQALETAMLEVRQPILHREVSRDRNVVTSGALWLLDLAKEDFPGRDKLLELMADSDGQRTVGLAWDADGPGANGPDAGGSGGAAAPGRDTVVLAGDQEVGTLLCSAYSPALEKYLGLATVPQDLAASGLPLTVRSDGTSADALTMAPPYVVPSSWTTPIL
jgi:glycine cleavage system aminomethyltransferase T